jgi:membrane-associated phospholipid phosphatase
VRLAPAFGTLVLLALAMARAPAVSAQARAAAPAGPAVAAAPETTARAVLADDIGLGLHLVGHGLTAPLRWTTRQWLAIPAAAGVLLAVGLVDDDVDRFAGENQGPVADGFFGFIEPFGEEYSIIVGAGLYATGWILADPDVRRTAVEAAASSVVAGLIVTPALKLVFGRARPRQQLGAREFNPFSGDKSFPSGHTTQAFAVASVIAAESGSLAVDLLAYGVAAGVGGARIYHDAHFLSDVLAGAAIGTVVGRAMVREGRRDAGLEPFVGPAGDGVGVGLRVRVGPGANPRGRVAPGRR